MRRYGVFIFIFLLIVAAVSADTDLTIPTTFDPNYTSQEIHSNWRIPVDLHRSVDGLIPAGSDACGVSVTLPLALGELSSGAMVTNNYSSNSTDPDITSCMWGTPQNQYGYRSLWYYFRAPATGSLTIQAVPNFDSKENYDTVIAVYEGDSCNDLTLRTCNDDYNGFLSQVTYEVEQNKNYFVEVVDRQQSVNGTAKLSLQAWIDQVDVWKRVETIGGDELNPLANRSRHATVRVGDYIFLIGGQTVLDVSAPIRTASVSSYNVVTNEWQVRAPMPPICDPNGYSNMQAVLVQEKIYVPSGYVGDNTSYSGVHCVYDTAKDSWSTEVSAPWEAEPVGYTAIAAYNNLGYYLTGGINGSPYPNPSPNATARAEVYGFRITSQGGTWLTNIPDMSSGRYGHSSIVLPNQTLCVVGGITTASGGLSPRSTGECIDLTNVSEGWQAIRALPAPRYLASSTIGPDGRWYIFGGMSLINNTTWKPDETIVAYDPDSNNWDVLPRKYNIDEPPRAWTGGAFVGDQLYVLGGETFTPFSITAPRPNYSLVGLVEHAIVGVEYLVYLPFMSYQTPYRVSEEPNNTFWSAQYLPMNSDVAGNFHKVEDNFDFYQFNLDVKKKIKIILYSVPQGENYDIYIYDSNKLLVGRSTNIANLDEVARLNLEAGTYYIQVVAEQNAPLILDDYRIVLTDNNVDK